MTGAVCPIRVDGRAVSAGVAIPVPDGALVSIGAPWDGLRSYLSVRGGIDAVPVLGSRSRDTLGASAPHRSSGRPGRARRADDALDPLHRLDAALRGAPRGRRTALPARPEARLGRRAGQVGLARRIRRRPGGGPARRRPSPQAGGGTAERADGAGAIQVPPSGEPVLCLADHPVTGGYPVAGVLTERAADRAAQLRPGQRCRLIAVGQVS
ncbi:biotin-dependent carboxyltransferase family protein [Tessaracoccus sp. HDW20]|nr:biotin-dependent carboxyltransferase family protein [Tessaracoccus coleopterorum]